jgi:hypothetical protein
MPRPAAVPAPVTPDWPITTSLRNFARLSGLGHNSTYGLLGAGEIDSVVSGGYRLILVSSYIAYLQRRLHGVERDPTETAAAITRYRISLGTARGARRAAVARAGKGKTRRMAVTAAAKAAETGPKQRSLFPQPRADLRKSSDSKKQVGRKETIAGL